MGLFDIFRNRNDRQTVSLPRICYEIAYTALPYAAYNNCENLVKSFTDGPIPVGTYFYVTVCQALKIKVDREDAKRFREHFGELDEARDYFVLEYPAPPPVDLTNVDLSQLPREQMPVLAPYFSAVVRHRQRGVVNYYTLGQASMGGRTTLRTVTPDDANCSLGDGPEPQFDAFLAWLRKSR